VAIETHTDSPQAQATIALALLEKGHRQEAMDRVLAEPGLAGGSILKQLLAEALDRGELNMAGACAELLAALTWGSRYFPTTASHPSRHPPPRPPDASLTAPKLRHDAQQLQYLYRRQLIDPELAGVSALYERWAERLDALGEHTRLPLEGAALSELGSTFNRIVFLRETPRVRRALGRWDRARAEAEYAVPPGVAVVDDFLSAEALENLRAFCLESTIWSSTRHSHGRLGSQFHNGFACPLLMQVATELREALPNVIRDLYPFRHVWGYKTPSTLPPDATIHADFAAVNVNFWLTPNEANLDPQTGGLVIYGIEAPADWTFDMYNGRDPDLIRPFLSHHRHSALYIPYRQNRAIIFNSDLFHGTAEARFKPGYENSRINVTMLYGPRAADRHHRAASALTESLDGQSWRSASMSRWR
jgi:hypothetical protein